MAVHDLDQWTGTDNDPLPSVWRDESGAMTDVLVLSDLWPPFPGGAERLMFNLSRDLLRHGADVRVLTSYAAFREFDGPPVTFADVGVFERHALGEAVIHDALRLLQPSVILTHHLFAFEFAALLEACRVPVVQVVLNGQRLAFAAHAVFISEFVKNMAGMESRPGDQVLLPPAFDDVIAPEHEHAIGFIKPIPHKGVHLVYDIARRMPDEQFVVLRGEWQDLEVTTDLPNVRYVEPVDDIRDFYKLVDIVLVPSVSEDAGTVVQECCLNRIPVLSSDVGGLPEANTGCFQIKPHELEHWLAAIRWVRDNYVFVLQMQGDYGYSTTARDAGLNLFVRRVSALIGR